MDTEETVSENTPEEQTVQEDTKRVSKRRIWIASAAVGGILVIGGISYGVWQYNLPKFHDVTIELGSQLPEITAFLTKDGKEKKSSLVTDTSDIDLTLVGDQTLTFRHGWKEETVTLSIHDTTPPDLILQDVTTTASETLTPEDFVASVTDLSDVSLRFSTPLTEPERYGTYDVEIIAEDTYGNTTSAQCTVSYQWMIAEFTLELGNPLTKKDLLFDSERDDKLINQEDLDSINNSPVGVYTLVSRDGDTTSECVVTVQDTTAPAITLEEKTIYKDGSVSLSDFLVSATDASGEVKDITLKTTPDTSKTGDVAIEVEAKDVNGNTATAQTVLHIVNDTDPPVFYGVDTLTVTKNSTADFKSGVSAYDARDGYVTFTYNSDNVDTSKAGTYYATYSAADSLGNKASYRRKVVVIHNQEDTDALVRSIAAGLSSDPEEIRDYVRNNISYSHDWGDNDPIWYGFTQKKGNCYVHASCFKALLAQKGIESQIIWATDKHHYWLVVNLNGVWRHMDATPGYRQHMRYSIMTDDMRQETLSGVWDRTKWPACN